MASNQISSFRIFEIITIDTLIGAGVIAVVILGVRLFTPQHELLSVILHVPFTAQAPTNNWARNEDCEETSIVMANAYLDGQTEDRLPASLAQKAINELKAWENANIGYNANTGADATMQMARGAFGLTVSQIKDFTEQDLKRELTNNRVILLPLNARKLGNPAYQNSGPVYHMIVVRGYNTKEFIVNDPGTDRGDGNVYTFATLKAAAADWDNVAQAIDPTRKIVLVLSK